MKLGQILIQKNWIRVSELEQIVEQQKNERKRLGELLLDADSITVAQLNNALQEQYWRKNGYWVIN